MYKKDILGFKGEIIGISFHGKRKDCHVVKLNNELNALIALNGQLQPIFCEPEEISRMVKICLDLCKNKVESNRSIIRRIELLGENVRLAKMYVLVKNNDVKTSVQAENYYNYLSTLLNFSTRFFFIRSASKTYVIYLGKHLISSNKIPRKIAKEYLPETERKRARKKAMGRKSKRCTP